MRPRLFWGIGVLTVIAAGLAILNEALPLRWHLFVFQILVEELWKRKIHTATLRLSQWREDPSQWESWKEVLFVRYSMRGRLLGWNTTQWILPSSPPSLFSPAPEIVSDAGSLYYAIKLPQDSIVHVAFIPIRVKAQNPPWEFPIAGDHPWIHQLRLRESSTGTIAVTLPSLQGMPLLRFSIGNPQALRIPLRKIYLFFFSVALVLGLLLLHQWLVQRFSFWKSRILFLLTLLLVWQALSLSQLPARLWGGNLFSPKLLSLMPFLQNLWDLEWLLVICAYATTLLKRVRISHYAAYAGVFVGVWGVIGGSLYLLALHSQIEPDPLRQPTLLKTLTWILVLGILWRTSEFLLRIHQGPLAFHIGFTIVIAVFGFYIGLSLWGILFIAFLYLLPLFLRQESFPYLLYPLYAVVMVGTLNAWLTYAYQQRVKTTLSVYARRASILRDHALEYQLSQLLPRIAADTTLWLQLESEDQLIDAQFISKIIQRYFISFAEDYELILSFWTKDNHRLDNLYERRPLLWHALPVTASLPTLSPYLHLVTYEGIRYIYLVRLPISPPDLPPFEMQIEFYPRSQPLSARLHTPPDPLVRVSYAVYENGKRIRQYGEETFPFTFTERIPTGAEWRVTSTHYEYITSSVTGITLYLRAPIRDLPTHLATFPVFLILLSITPLFQKRLYILSYLRRLYHREGSLAMQLQGLFGLVLILPLIAMLLISFFLSLRISQTQLQQELSQKLSSISAYLSANPTLTEKLSFWLHNYLPPEESHLRDLIRRVATIADAEIFIYTREGILYTSTLFQSYFHGHVSPLLPPEVLRHYQRPGTQILVQVERDQERLAGYAPIRTAAGNLVGIIYIPRPLPTEKIYEPLKNFIAFTVNAYLVLMLGSLLLGMVLIRRFSERLKSLEQQLRARPYTPTPPRLHWNGKGDEIAALVSAYNEMVERLHESQKELEATLRRVSQQEMAFQAAHEIKTALTPLKIHLQHLQRLPSVEPEKLREISTRLLQRVEALVRIANAFMSFGRLSSPDALPLQPIHLNTFLEEVLQPYMQNPHVTFTLQLPPYVVWIEANADALQQILNNLLQNALQALEAVVEPCIKVSLTLQNQEAIISVQDNGPGIPAEVQERIFEFYFTTRRTGTGLGLAITKGLVERMGGRITFESRGGEGTTFYVIFPTQKG